jgi:BREX protein BrxB
MISLEDSLKRLEADLVAQPMRLAAHSDMPFAIFRYLPQDEFPLRKNLRLLAFSLSQNHQRDVVFMSISQLVWDIVRQYEGTDYLFKTESVRGFRPAQEHVNKLLTSTDYRPVTDEMLSRIRNLDPAKHVLFLVRAGGFAPFIFRCSALLDGLHHQTMVPTILFYPGSAEVGTDLRFYDLPVEGSLGVYNYRVKIYGTER